MSEWGEPIPTDDKKHPISEWGEPVAHASQWSDNLRVKPTRPLDFQKYGEGAGWLERRVTDIHNLGEGMRGRREAWEGRDPQEMWTRPTLDEWAKRTDAIAKEDWNDAGQSFADLGRTLRDPKGNEDPMSVPRVLWDSLSGAGDVVGTLLSPAQSFLEQIPGKYIEAKTGLSKEMVGSVLSSLPVPASAVVDSAVASAKTVGGAAKVLGNAAKAAGSAFKEGVSAGEAAKAATKVAEVSGLEPLHQMRPLKYMVPKKKPKLADMMDMSGKVKPAFMAPEWDYSPQPHPEDVDRIARGDIPTGKAAREFRIQRGPDNRFHPEAKAEGLDLSEAARMARAKAQGYNTNEVWWHGHHSNIDRFDPSKKGQYPGVTYFSADPGTASAFGSKGTPVHLRTDRILDLRDPKITQSVNDILVKHGHQPIPIKGKHGPHPHWAFEDAFHDPAVQEALSELGYDGVFLSGDGPNRQAMIWNQAGIRHIDAVFNPKHKDSDFIHSGFKDE